MTTSANAIFLTILYGAVALFLINFFIYRAIGKKRWYLPCIDLVSFTIAGLAIGSLIWIGFNSFSAEYPKVLDANGQTNVLEPYRPYVSQLRERYQANCPNGPVAGDCTAIEEFMDRIWAEDPDGQPVLVRYNRPFPEGATEESLTLMRSYKGAYDRVPMPYEITAELFRHLNFWYVAALAFAWSLGVVRRWIIFWREIRAA